MAPALSCVNENAGAFKFNLLHKKPHFSRDAARGQCHIRRKEILHTLCKRVADEHFYVVFARFYGFRNIPAVRAADALPHVLAVYEQLCRYADIFKFKLYVCRIVYVELCLIPHFAGKLRFTVFARDVKKLRVFTERLELRLLARLTQVNVPQRLNLCHMQTLGFLRKACPFIFRSTAENEDHRLPRFKCEPDCAVCRLATRIDTV